MKSTVAMRKGVEPIMYIMNTLYEYTISGEYIVHKENFTNISKTKKT